MPPARRRQHDAASTTPTGKIRMPSAGVGQARRLKAKLPHRRRKAGIFAATHRTIVNKPL
jgi:hypothetical protein